MLYGNNPKNSEWSFVDVDFSVKPREAKSLHNLNLTYAEIFKKYMISQINRFGANQHVMYPSEWMNNKLNDDIVKKCLIGKTSLDDISYSVIVNILQRGFNDLLNNHKCDKVIRDIYNEHGVVRSRDCIQLLHDMKLFGKYNLTVPHIPIQSTFNIGDQIVIKRSVKIPKYDKKLHVPKHAVEDFPINVTPKSARIYTRFYKDGRYRVYATVSCLNNETDDEGFTKLLRKYMRG